MSLDDDPHANLPDTASGGNLGQDRARFAQRAAAKRGEQRDPVAWLAELDEEETNLADSWRSRGLAPSLVDKMAARIEKERAEARAAIAAEESAKPVAALIADGEAVARTWPKLSFEKKRTVVDVPSGSLPLAADFHSRAARRALCSNGAPSTWRHGGSRWAAPQVTTRDVTVGSRRFRV